MDVRAFKAWLDGFGHAIDGAPTEDQWRMVLAKLADVQEPAPVPSRPEAPDCTSASCPRRLWATALR